MIILLVLFQSGWLLSYIIDLVWTSSTMLNRLGESRHPCFLPDLRGKAFLSLPLSMAMSFSHVAFLILI